MSKSIQEMVYATAEGFVYEGQYFDPISNTYKCALVVPYKRRDIVDMRRQRFLNGTDMPPSTPPTANVVVDAVGCCHGVQAPPTSPVGGASSPTAQQAAALFASIGNSLQESRRIIDEMTREDDPEEECEDQTDEDEEIEQEEDDDAASITSDPPPVCCRRLPRREDEDYSSDDGSLVNQINNEDPNDAPSMEDVVGDDFAPPTGRSLIDDEAAVLDMEDEDEIVAADANDFHLGHELDYLFGGPMEESNDVLDW